MLFLFFLQVNTNGVISFTGTIGESWFSRIDARNASPVVKPLSCDADTTRNNGRVYYRATTDNATLQQASSDVAKGTGFAATFVFITTWHNVTFKIRPTRGPVSKSLINS